MLFPSARRAFVTLLKTPVVPPPAPAVFELNTIAGPSRPRAFSRTYSNMSVRSVYEVPVQSRRTYVSKPGKEELYSDEAGDAGTAGVSLLLA